MKFNIDDYKGKYVMHCNTEEEAQSFVDYLKTTGWDHTWSLSSYYGRYVCFFNEGTWCNKEYAISEGYTILEWSDFMNKEFTGEVIMIKCNRSGICPLCGSENLNYEAAVIEDVGVMYPWTCECGAKGEETYNLEFSGHYAVEKDDVYIDVVEDEL